MSRSSLIRLAVAGIVGVVAASALIGLLLFVNAGDGFALCTATTRLGWLVPIVAGVGIAGVAFVLLSDRPIGSEGEDVVLAQACCSECGGIIRGDWRLCPHCGARLG